MNDIALAQPAEVVKFETWVETGRTLAGLRREADWRLADWLNEGRESGFMDQAGFDFLADNLGIAPKRLKDISRAVEAFPAHLRDATLSIDHHASVAALPKQEAMELLHAARDANWTPERTRHEAARRKVRDERAPREEGSELESFLRHWNRLPKAIRMEAAEMIRDSHGEEIEP